ncbi:MAG: DUF58 domain-containing protein [Rhodoferax sp.]|uniref:DUF58 domain-containing protein n=1 Tax=Rhodoferax sp. TaxID=50421 RepID=UPI0026365D84|nr:DUF58 domain-containing protein [Rhodoferax sp.]MDD5335526.1 DUF58 domain-containing protein [Rhodoferax sp.]
MKWFQNWLEARLSLRDSITLTQRNVYILPTGPGFMLAATLLLLLLTSINYQLNLGYLLTFLLAGCALVGMHVGHATLRGLTMNLLAPEPQFAGASATISIYIQNPRRGIRHGIGLAVLGSGHWLWTDLPALGSCTVHIAFQPTRRGLHRVPTLTAETRFPLGTFRVWTVWRPAAQVLVYPAPEPFPPALPPGQPRAEGAARAHLSASGEYDGVRAYRRGDPLKLIVWKKAAKADELVSRDAQQLQHLELWLERHHCGTSDPEQQLSRLCAWVLLVEQQGLDYGLRLGALEIKPGSGEVHKKRCLEALALC